MNRGAEGDSVRFRVPCLVRDGHVAWAASGAERVNRSVFGWAIIALCAPVAQLDRAPAF